MVRILCLHGHGTTGRLFEAQLSQLRRHLPDDFEFSFADGEVECPRAPGIPQAVPGPFLCYFNNFSTADLEAAHELLEVIIEEDGPFDGVFAFSQGASLVISYLLEQERKNPEAPAPFQFAILFSPTVALSPDAAFCDDDVANITDADFEFFSEVVNDASGNKDVPQKGTYGTRRVDFTEPEFFQPISNPIKRRDVLVSSMGGILRAGLKTNFLSASEFSTYIEQHDKSIVPRLFHPALLKERVRIPTVHVVGEKDDEDLQSQFKVMPFLCEPHLTKVVVHAGGHDVPRTIGDVKATAKAVEWAVAEGRMSLL